MMVVLLRPLQHLRHEPQGLQLRQQQGRGRGERQVGMEKMEREIRAAYQVDAREPRHVPVLQCEPLRRDDPPQAMPT